MQALVGHWDHLESIRLQHPKAVPWPTMQYDTVQELRCSMTQYRNYHTVWHSTRTTIQYDTVQELRYSMRQYRNYHTVWHSTGTVQYNKHDTTGGSMRPSWINMPWTPYCSAMTYDTVRHSTGTVQYNTHDTTGGSMRPSWSNTPRTPYCSAMNYDTVWHISGTVRYNKHDTTHLYEPLSWNVLFACLGMLHWDNNQKKATGQRWKIKHL